jgi:polyphosphate kinase
MRARFLELIERETAHGPKGRIVAKMNSLEDPGIIEKLYAASEAGVRIDLWVRGFCCLRPGVPGLSETIKVRSVIGRFLEHSRAYLFFNGQADPAQAETFIGSADWMSRNLNNRVETIAPVLSTSARQEIWEVLQMYADDTALTWILNSDGSYTHLHGSSEVPSVQERLMARARDRVKAPGA